MVSKRPLGRYSHTVASVRAIAIEIRHWDNDDMRYVLFLRGINVGGIKVPMSDLRDSLGDMGFEDVRTYLQTGNAVFEFSQPLELLKQSIEAMLSARFRYKASVFIYPFDVLSSAIHDFPYHRSDKEHGYVIFCENKTIINDLLSHEPDIDHEIESIKSGKHVVYWRVPKGRTLDTPFGKIIAKSKYKTLTTNRNINTLEKMLR